MISRYPESENLSRNERVALKLLVGRLGTPDGTRFTEGCAPQHAARG